LGKTAKKNKTQRHRKQEEKSDYTSSYLLYLMSGVFVVCLGQEWLVLLIPI
jgi:hypothetical protein